MRYSARNYAMAFHVFPVEVYLPDKSTVTKWLEEAKNGNPECCPAVMECCLSGSTSNGSRQTFKGKANCKPAGDDARQ